MSSAICFNLDQPKILSSGNGLSVHIMMLSWSSFYQHSPQNSFQARLATFTYNHCRNNGQWWEMNESCSNNYHWFWEYWLRWESNQHPSALKSYTVMTKLQVPCHLKAKQLNFVFESKKHLLFTIEKNKCEKLEFGWSHEKVPINGGCWHFNKVFHV